MAKKKVNAVSIDADVDELAVSDDERVTKEEGMEHDDESK